MTRDELKRLFPNASISCLAVNSGEVAIVECGVGVGTLATGEAKEQHSGKFLVRVTSRRRRLIDEDNLCEKFHVDCCRYAGLLPGDDPEQARIEVRQEKVGKCEAEETVIEIFQLKALEQ